MDKKKVLIIGITSVILAVVIGYFASTRSGNKAKKAPAVKQSINIPVTPPPPPPPPKIVIASKDIASHTIISADDITYKILPKPWNKDYITYQKKSTVLDKITKTDIEKGAPILPDYFYTEKRLAHLVPLGKRAIPITVNSKTSVNSLIKLGDYVDVIFVTSEGMGSNKGRIISKIVTQKSKVLALDRSYLPKKTVTTAAPTANKSGKPLPPGAKKKSAAAPPMPPGTAMYKTVILAVTPIEAESLAMLEKQTSADGELKLILRNTQENRKVYTPGSAGAEFFSDDFRNKYVEPRNRKVYQKEIEVYKGTLRGAVQVDQ